MQRKHSAEQHLNRRFLPSLLVISFLIGLIEILVLQILNFYQNNVQESTRFQGIAMNAFLLALVSAPLLWFVVLRPLVMQITREQVMAADRARLNAELRAALDAHALVSITDKEGRIVYANDKFCQVSRYSREELLGKDHRILNSGYHGKDYISGLWEKITQGQIWQGVLCNRRKDGRLYWVDSTIKPLLDETGKPYQYISIRRDITAKKEASEKLIILKHAVDACSEMILVTDAQGYIQYANPALYRSTGWTETTLVGRNTSVLDSPNAERKPWPQCKSPCSAKRVGQAGC